MGFERNEWALTALKDQGYILYFPRRVQCCERRVHHVSSEIRVGREARCWLRSVLGVFWETRLFPAAFGGQQTAFQRFFKGATLLPATCSAYLGAGGQTPAWGNPKQLEQKGTQKESVEYLSSTPWGFAFAMNHLNSQCRQALKRSDLFCCHKKPNKPSFSFKDFISFQISHFKNALLISLDFGLLTFCFSVPFSIKENTKQAIRSYSELSIIIFKKA